MHAFKQVSTGHQKRTKRDEKERKGTKRDEMEESYELLPQMFAKTLASVIQLSSQATRHE